MTGGLSNIDARLENWGEWCQARTSHRVNAADAWVIEQRMCALPAPQRELLTWCYVKRAVPEVICRKVGIPHRPIGEFLKRLEHAKAAIKAIVE
ncbi:hypothetical protein [Massilia sp. METH4]|uniref:hypothetical protein n=1 Tax=Massilia sp. METH4 TaxID=3123041 RepID=UPI0030D1FEBA